jgi:hypothetical protein
LTVSIPQNSSVALRAIADREQMLQTQMPPGGFVKDHPKVGRNHEKTIGMLKPKRMLVSNKGGKTNLDQLKSGFD